MFVMSSPTTVPTIRHIIDDLIDLSPPLYHVDRDMVVSGIQHGLKVNATQGETLTYGSEYCAGLGARSYDYSILAGRIAAAQLQRSTPATFKEAMSILQPVLDESFVQRIQTHDYDRYIDSKYDFQYDILGLTTLKRSYLLKHAGKIVERPSYMLMRVAVYLTRTPMEAADMYRMMSEGYYTHASPTLFHAGMKMHQLASCFLMTMIDDSIEGIYDTLKRTAVISKSAGGIGISVSNIRCKGSQIAGTNGTSNGLKDMLRVFNNTARYCDQGGGKRKGSFAIYIEPWHGDVLEVIQMKLNHGVEEDRARDLFYALWIPDLFMKRVQADEQWSLFCPKDVPELQNTYGDEFEEHYVHAETSGKAKRTLPARELFGKIIDVQIETGTPYLLYKHACNQKSNQKHLGTIKSSNLCAEIVEYSAPEETSVCTLASIALPKFVDENGFNFDKLVEVAGAVCNNLNRVIDKTTYPIDSTKTSNMRHRPIGIGVQGLADVYQMMGYPYDSSEAACLNHQIFESIYYGAVKMSIALAKTDGPYETFPGSPTASGQFNFDLWQHTPSERYDWTTLRHEMLDHGMRNSLLVALMPTASSASILGNTESFEPRTSNLYVRRVLSGEFMILNKYLEAACRKRNLWTEELRDSLIQHRGSVAQSTLPDDMKAVFKTVWELSMKTLIDQSRQRAPYVCQSQSLNLYQAAPTAAKLTSMHFYAWKQGLKTGQYYLRTRPKADAVAFTAKQPVDEVCVSCEA